METIFNNLYSKYHQDVFQFLFYMVKNKEVAEDLTQDVYIKALKAYHQFREGASEKTWLYSIAKNTAIDYLRRQKYVQLQQQEEYESTFENLRDIYPIPEEVTVRNEDIKIMYKALKNCTADQQIVINMKYIQGLSNDEVAKSLGWSLSKVKTVQHRGLKTLKKHIEKIA